MVEPGDCTMPEDFLLPWVITASVVFVLCEVSLYRDVYHIKSRVKSANQAAMGFIAAFYLQAIGFYVQQGMFEIAALAGGLQAVLITVWAHELVVIVITPAYGTEFARFQAMKKLVTRAMVVLGAILFGAFAVLAGLARLPCAIYNAGALAEILVQALSTWVFVGYFTFVSSNLIRQIKSAAARARLKSELVSAQGRIGDVRFHIIVIGVVTLAPLTYFTCFYILGKAPYSWIFFVVIFPGVNVANVFHATHDLHKQMDSSQRSDTPSHTMMMVVSSPRSSFTSSANANQSIQSLLCSPHLDAFRLFVEREKCSELLSFVEDITAWQARFPNVTGPTRFALARKLFAKYLESDVINQVNVSAEHRMAVRRCLQQQTSDVDVHVFDDALKEVISLLEAGPWSRFIREEC